MEANKITTLETLVAQDQLEEALARLESMLQTLPGKFSLELTMLQNRQQALTKDRDLTTESAYRLDQRKLVHDFLSLLNDIRDELQRHLRFYNPIPLQPDASPALKEGDAATELMSYLQSRIANRYEITQKLREGTSVINFKARDIYTGREVIIKVLKRLDSLQMQGVKEEVERVARLKHRSIIKIYDLNFDQYPYFLITEYVWGVDLEEVLQSTQTLPLYMVLELLCDLCDSLDYIHRWRIFHTNIRPSKIMLDEENKCMISPFEVIRAGNETRTLEKFREDCRYLAPELLATDLRASSFEEAEKADQFSLGLLAFELLTGKPLFTGDSIPELIEERERFYKRKSLDPYIPGFLKQPGYRPFWDIIDRLLQKEPTDRFLDLNRVGKLLNGLRPEMTELHEILLYSYNRCLASPKGNFINAFYRNFFDKAPTWEARFPDLDRQHKMFRTAVRMFLESGSHPSLLENLNKIKGHREIGFEQYKLFLDAFLETVAAFDPCWSERAGLQKAWKELHAELLVQIGEITAAAK
jgi:serine/threonine protein kinase